MSIGDNIRKYRKAKNLTQQDLANEIGVHEATIRGYESGKYTPKHDKVALIAEKLGVSILEIYKGEHLEKLILEHEIRTEDRQKLINSALEGPLALHEPYLSFFLNKMQQQNQSSTEEVNQLKNILQNNAFVIDTDIDPNHPYNIAMAKLRANEALTVKDQKALAEHNQEALKRLKEDFRKFGKTLQDLYSVCEELNDDGQKKVLEHAEMIAKIPEYRKDTTENTEE